MDKEYGPDYADFDWDCFFKEQSWKVKVRIAINNVTITRIEKMIEMGKKKGGALRLSNLVNELETSSKKW